MEINRKNAMKIWEDQFGKIVQAVDFAGRKIQKGAYDQKTSDFGWALAYIVPKTEGGAANPENMICVHVKTAEEKGDDYPVFSANDKKYSIKKDNGEFLIEEATDSESIAEQQAKIEAAMDRWSQFFGEAEIAIDFCGRKIIKSEYNTESELAWKIAPYVTSKPTENRNAYIANVLSVEEALGKTAFKANGKNYTLNKENGAYYFKALEVKPQKKPFEVTDVAEVIERVRACNASYEEHQSSGIWMDFIIVKAVTSTDASSATAATLIDTVSMLLKEQVGDRIGLEVSELVEESGSRYMFLTYRFASPHPDDLDRIFGGCMLLNTYAPVFFRELGLEEFKIYNFASCFDVAQVQYPISQLAEYNQELKALMQAIYQSAYGFYDGESPVTLYVSRFIVYNIPALSEMHLDEETTYFTEAQMTEHNFVFTELRTEIQNEILAEIAAEEEDAQQEEPEAMSEADAAAEYAAYVQAEDGATEVEENAVEAGLADELVQDQTVETEVAETPAEEYVVQEEDPKVEAPAEVPVVVTQTEENAEEDDGADPIETF